MQIGMVEPNTVFRMFLYYNEDRYFSILSLHIIPNYYQFTLIIIGLS